jgi:starch-binding outer membrane protein, SusD/RagB family
MDCNRIKIAPMIMLIVIVTFIAGCRKELDKSPLDQFDNGKFWTSEENALLALTGVYRGKIRMDGTAETEPTDWWSYQGIFYLDLASDNAYDRRGDESPFNKLSNGTLTANVGVLTDFWELSYDRIARANFFLENVDKTPMDTDKITRFKAEARFIRACQYFYMSQYWGAVPLVTKTLTLEEANNVKKASKEEIVNFTINELQEIANELPSYGALAAAERGRASQQAALAFLGRLQLAEQLYGEAATTYKAIIDAGENTIDPDYVGLFNGKNETSTELIFATQFLANLAGNGIMQHTFPRSSGGWHLYCPLGSLVEAYQFDDGTPFAYTDPRYNPNNLIEKRDPRLAYSVITNGDTFANLLYISHPDSTTSVDQLTTTKQATRTGYGIRKFNDETFSGDLQNSGIDLPIVRYAEVLLSYLEAKLENGDPVDQTLLDETINKVRTRTAVNMPPISTTDPSELRNILRNERRVELAFEGIRYWDLLRWGIAKEVLNGDFYGEPFPTAKNLRVKPGGAKDTYGRWYVTSKAFREGTDNQWPIPQSEVNINPNLQ